MVHLTGIEPASLSEQPSILQFFKTHKKSIDLVANIFHSPRYS